MKFRFALITSIAVLAILLSACSFTLAEDVTPPPGYVPPTPAPTLGPLFPAQVPNVENGAAIYVEKCLPCHGTTGLGDGPQGIQLGVTVSAYGLPDIARPASLAQWYTTVTRGNIERFMPPFVSLTDQQRWDVVAYAMTLHMSQEQIQKGRDLFEANCSNCSTDFFKNQENMSPLSEVDLARIVTQGNDQVKAFGTNLTADEVWALAEYLRTLSFDNSTASAATPEAVAAAETPVPTDAVTPSVEGTPIEGTPQAQVAKEATAIPQPGFGIVSGAVENKTGADLPSDLKITLHGYDHGTDPNAGPQEVLTLNSVLNADGTYTFDKVEIPTNRIFISEIILNGITVQSGFAVVADGVTSVSLSPITLYSVTNDTSALVMDELHIFFDYTADATVQVFGVYSFRNTSDKTIMVSLGSGSEISFLKAPDGSSGFGYEPMQDSPSFVSTDNGFGIPPNEKPYGLIAFASLPKSEKVDFSQAFVLPVTKITIFLPEGVQAENSQMTDLGIQATQNVNFHVYQSDGAKAGDTLKFTISGTPKESTNTTTTTPATNTNRNLLIGAGALGLVLILAGGWMYLRDRNRATEDETDDDDGFESSEDVMDAIVALDDLHRAKKIPDEAYQKRRSELKEILKGMM